MQQANRSKLCKLQNKPGGKDVYILYEIDTKPFTKYSMISDFAGLFDTKHDAEQVAECLNNIFSKLSDKHWRLKSYNVEKVYFFESISERVYNPDNFDDYGDYHFSDDSDSDDEPEKYKYEVYGNFYSKFDKDRELESYKTEHILAISKSLKSLENRRQTQIAKYKKYPNLEFKITKYRTNDILPTMYLEDYNKTLHHKKFKHVINELKDMPHAQANRKMLRRAAREKLFEYSDSSDSEDDTKYKRVTKRSLLHTPNKVKKK